jgi:hypothetical protein
MKVTILFLFLCLSIVSHTALSQYDNGDKLINAGVGLNPYNSSGFPIGASFEYGFMDAISLGVSLDIITSTYRTTTGNDFTVIYTGARGSFHFNELFNHGIEKLDLYAGATIGYRSFIWNKTTNIGGLGSAYTSGLFVGAHAGARYYFTQNLGAFLEVGVAGSSNARTGIAVRF